MKKQLVIRPRRFDKAERDKGRVVLADHFLWELMRSARKQLDPATFVQQGGLDAEEFLECLDTGNVHPLLDRWRNLKSIHANHPPPTTRDRFGRRLVVLATVALERAVSLDKEAARKLVAKAVAESFDDAPSAEAIRHWQREQAPPTEVEERVTITAALRRTRPDDDAGNAQRVIEYFTGLIWAAMTPEGAVQVKDMLENG